MDGDAVIEILGSSVSALVATERLMAAGVGVRRTPTGRPSPFGFHVLPDGREVEVGCKLLELTYDPSDWYVAGPSLTEFEPGSQHGHRPWISDIREYVEGLVDVGPEVQRLATRLADPYGPTLIATDPFLSGDPTSVSGLLTADEREDAIWELRSFGPRTVADYPGLVYPEAARMMCAETVPRAVLWPLFHKIAGWADVPAAQHRKVWLPLWQSQSLLDALRGEPSYQPVRPMHFGIAALYEALETATKEALGDGCRDGFSMGADEFDLHDFHASESFTSPPSVPIGVAWVADDHAPGVEWLIDADVPVFRRTWHGDDICCVEYAAGANIERWCYDLGHDLLDKVEVRCPIGDVVCDDPRAVGYGNLGDQIVQGLAAADRLIRERA